MALTEETVNDKIEVVVRKTYKVIQVRTATVIKRDGEEISRNFHRRVVFPNADLTQEDADVSALGAVVFTQAVKDAFAAIED
jgi:hypothetical protein